MSPTTPAPPRATSTLPYVFVDVDGVLNALATPTDAHERQVLAVTGGRYLIQIRHAVLEWLRRLGDLADVRWATTWQDHANEVLAPAFGLPQLPVACRTVDEHGVAVSHGWWKLAGVIATVAAERRPFVWIDDEAIPVDVADHLAAVDVPYLCVEPDPLLGLTDEQLAEIGAFLDRHR